MRWFGRHLGATVSALVDGQMAPEESEQAWQHVLRCPGCRRLVQREGWVKRQLAWRPQTHETPSERLLGNLYGLDPDTLETTMEAWATVDALEQRGRSWRRAGIALVGAGSVSAAVFGLSALSAAPLGIGTAPAGAPTAALSRAAATSAPTRAGVAPRTHVEGRLPGWRVESGRAVAVDDRY
ncbi:MAG: hypothetical protein ACTHOK_03585 [Nocardioidaceae bacterium]